MKATTGIPGYRRAHGDETRCGACKHGMMPDTKKACSNHRRFYCTWHSGMMSVAKTHTCSYINGAGGKPGKRRHAKS